MNESNSENYQLNRAKIMINNFLIFLNQFRPKDKQISIEKPTQEVDFELTEENYHYLEYGAFQLELPLEKYIEKVLEIEARKNKFRYSL